MVRVVEDVGFRVGGPTASSGAMASACDERWASIAGYNGGGETMWSLAQRVYWCYDGANVTYTYRTVHPYSNNGYQWYDLGTVSDSESCCLPSARYQAYHRHYFARCWPSPWGDQCGDHTRPWVEHLVTGYGGYATNAGY